MNGTDERRVSDHGGRLGRGGVEFACQVLGLIVFFKSTFYLYLF